MKVIKWVFGLVASLVLLLFVVSLFMPTTLELERSATVNAPRAEVFDMLIDMSQFNQFSPWVGIDPDAKYSYEGPQSGVGAKMSWQSEHPRVGNGWMSIAKIDGMEKIEVDLGFDAFEGKSQSWYLLRDVDGGTEVTWGYAGDVSKPYYLRLMAPMIKSQLTVNYDEGLTKLVDVFDVR